MSKAIEINGYPHVAYKHKSEDQKESILRKASNFYSWLNDRRSIRMFSDKKVDRDIIEQIILAASTAPSGAHKQPWTFCAVSNNSLKEQIRIAAEKEEKESYESRMNDRWLQDLAPLGTDSKKSFLEVAPWLIVAFRRIYEVDQNGSKYNNYYVNESVGIACGLLVAAIHNAGLVTLTHTPSPMNFLAQILNRPSNERAFILFPVGHPADEVYVPDIQRKSLDEVSIFYE